MTVQGTSAGQHTRPSRRVPAYRPSLQLILQRCRQGRAANMTNLFSVSALFIMYREALEACVVISVMLSIMGRLGLHRLKRQGDPRRARQPPRPQ